MRDAIYLDKAYPKIITNSNSFGKRKKKKLPHAYWGLSTIKEFMF